MSNYILPSAVRVDDYIKLTLLDDASVTYSGKVLGVCSYTVAKSMGSDIAARHEEVRSKLVASTGETIGDILTQNFILMDTGDTLPTVVAFDWISDGKVELIELGSSYTIKLLNCSKEKAEEAVSILRANSISCKLNVVY